MRTSSARRTRGKCGKGFLHFSGTDITSLRVQTDGNPADLRSRSVAASLYEISSELSSHKNEGRAEYDGVMIVRI